jgi:hypothetical protein
VTRFNYPPGTRRLGVCGSCRLEAHLTLNRNGWRCPHCNHTTPKLHPPNKKLRSIPSIVTSEYAAGYSISQIAEKYGASKHGVKERLIRAGIKLRPRGDWRGKRVA